MNIAPIPSKIDRAWVCLLLLAAAPLSLLNADLITLTGTVRDFNDSHPNFESYIGVDYGIVEDALGPDGKPVYAVSAGNPSTTTKADFDQWYRDVSGVNPSKSHTIVLEAPKRGESQGLITFQLLQEIA